MDQDSQEDYQTEKWVDNEEAHARNVIRTAKLVVPFSAAIAATFVSAAMQVADKSWWDDVATVFMVVALGLTIVVLMLPSRPPEAELDKDEFRDIEKRVVAAENALELATRTHCLMVTQVWASAISSVVAAAGLLIADWL